jgi:hypothetical protein
MLEWQVRPELRPVIPADRKRLRLMLARELGYTTPYFLAVQAEQDAWRLLFLALRPEPDHDPCLAVPWGLRIVRARERVRFERRRKKRFEAKALGSSR